MIPEFGIPRDNEERRDGGCAVIFDPIHRKYAVGSHASAKAYSLFSGGVERDEDITDAIVREVKEESGLYDFLRVEKIGEALTHYYNSRKNVNRVAYATCLLIILKSTDLVETKQEEHEKFLLVWKTKEEILENWKAMNQNQDYSHWIFFFEKAIQRIKELGYGE